jgi:hypothetical protein
VEVKQRTGESRFSARSEAINIPGALPQAGNEAAPLAPDWIHLRGPELGVFQDLASDEGKSSARSTSLHGLHAAAHATSRRDNT